jgi:hypothetical protein
VGVTEDHTDLRGGGTLLCELADLVNDLVGGGLEPGGGGARVGERRGADTLSLGMKTTHFDGICWLSRLSGNRLVAGRINFVVVAQIVRISCVPAGVVGCLGVAV